MKGLKVLSLFDGMACGLQALKQAGIKIDKYYASEIDKHAIQIAKKNHPEILHLGNVESWKEWELPEIDLLIGGSPCQGFSSAGKQLNFNDQRSALFFEFVKIKEHLKPKYFLLENVKMKKEWQKVISDFLGVEPVEINSALVSAQNRKRLYWCNWEVTPLEDKGIFLKDIIEDKDESIYVDCDKSYCIDAHYYNVGNLKSYFEKYRRQLVFVKEVNKGKIKKLENYIQYDTSGKGHGSQDQRAYYLNGKHGTLPSGGTSSKVKVLIDSENLAFRKLTPLECERLQTLPDNYTKGVSNTQRYKMIGNGWSVSVIEHIFRSLI